MDGGYGGGYGSYRGGCTDLSPGCSLPPIPPQRPPLSPPSTQYACPCPAPACCQVGKERAQWPPPPGICAWHLARRLWVAGKDSVVQPRKCPSPSRSFSGEYPGSRGLSCPWTELKQIPFWCSGNSPWGLTGLGVWLEQAGWPGASHMSASGLRGPAGSPVTSRLHGGHPGL